jgi:hypothetical protein
MRPRELEYEFVVSDPNGRIIGTISRNKVRARDAFSHRERVPNIDHRISCEGLTVATINERPRREVLARRAAPSTFIARAHYLVDHLCCSRFRIEDESGHTVARITYVKPYIVRSDDMGFVLESERGIRDPLRTMLLAIFPVVDRIRPRHHGQ